LIQTLIRNWWPVALCGVLDAIISAVYLSHAGRGIDAVSTVVLLGRLTLAAGVCTIAAGLWSGRSNSWLLVLNGVAGSALGLILAFWKGPLAFRTVALLLIVMALSIGIYQLASARKLWRGRVEEWLLGAAGVASVGFALVFLAFAVRWIKLEPGSPAQTLRWLGGYFGFCAICMLGLGPHNQGVSQSGPREALPRLGNPRHALGR
jgi:uncharacterized membrane protein HdeD (DUF308 family)